MVRKSRKGSKNKKDTEFKPPKEVSGSAGVWSGDNHKQIRLRVKFVGTTDLLLKPIPDFSKDSPSIIEPVLSMCFRSAAHYAGTLLRKYVPKKHMRDFLPFLMVENCELKYRDCRKTRMPITVSNGNGKEEVVGHETMNRVIDWGVTAEIVIAHFPGVDEHGIMTLFEKAGTEVGLGSRRPHVGGKFGTFQLAGLEVISGKWAPLQKMRRKKDETFVDVVEQIEEVRSSLEVSPDAISA